MNHFPRSGHLLVSAALLSVAAACSEAPSAPGPEPGPEPVDVDALFAPATAEEVATVTAEWAMRDPVARDVVVELDTVISQAESLITIAAWGTAPAGERTVPAGPAR